MSHDPIDVLAGIAADAKEIWCLCDLNRDGTLTQVKLHSRGNQKNVDALVCMPVGDGNWVEEREDVATIDEGLRRLAQRWGGQIEPDSIQPATAPMPRLPTTLTSKVATGRPVPAHARETE